MLVAECPVGTFSRQVVLGESPDVENVKASYDAGVLSQRIHSPKQPNRARSESAGAPAPSRNPVPTRSAPSQSGLPAAGPLPAALPGPDPTFRDEAMTNPPTRLPGSDFPDSGPDTLTSSLDSGVHGLTEEPGKVIRTGSMILRLLNEMRSSPLNDAAGTLLVEIHDRSVKELQGGLAPGLAEELHRLWQPLARGSPASGEELRIGPAFPPAAAITSAAVAGGGQSQPGGRPRT